MFLHLCLYKHFRCQIMIGAQKRKGDKWLFSQSKIRYLQVTIFSNQNVSRLQIPKQNILLMHRLKCKSNLGGINLNLLFGKSSFILDQSLQITALAILHHNVQISWVLKHTVSLNDERMLALYHEVSLGIHVTL